jgi:lipopolysaccharide/colanic/teichoic acid biosynthesis glycosyltransferase
MSWMVIERPTVKLYKPYYQATKRLFEIAVCLILLPIAIPVGLLIALTIRLDSPGPVLFVQDRIGKGNRLFKMYKFRTMCPDVNNKAHQVFMRAFVNGAAQENSEHRVYKPFKSHEITRVGRILRKTSLDEMPQLINVLKGEMSFVGPRPNVPWEVEEYRGWHKERLEVLPGITGLAQVRGRSGITFDKIVEYDIEYVENQSFWLDLRILWWTIASVVFGKGAH